MKIYNTAILGATGMVGQRFVCLLENHPYFKVKILAASEKSKGKKYIDIVNKKWSLDKDIPSYSKNLIILDAMNDLKYITEKVDIVFCALNLDDEKIRYIEEKCAKNECFVISNNSTNRKTIDVPMIIPELNHEHAKLIDKQKNRLKTKKGFIAVKSNCSIQSYVPALYPLKRFGIESVFVSTYQAISGSGQTLEKAKHIQDNIIPFINNEEEKSEIEPLKIFSTIKNGKLHECKNLKISTQCVRVPVSDGHLATVFVKFKNKPSKDEILNIWKNFKGYPQIENLYSAPKQFLHYFEENDLPQTRLQRDIENGMAISIGRLRKDSIFDYKFVCLSHNTIRGAAGGAILLAELLEKLKYIH